MNRPRLQRSIAQETPRRMSRMQSRVPSKGPSIVDVAAYARRTWEALDTPISLSCYLLARNGEWAQLVKKSVDPSAYTDPLAFYLDYQAVKLIAKCPGLETGFDTELAAKRKFIECEVSCLETNGRFQFGSLPPFAAATHSVIERARKKIDRILGPVPDLSELDFRFGPGAAYGIRGDTSAYQKLTSVPECTRNMLPLLPDFLGEFPAWFDADLVDVTIVQGSELTFVPKDATTDRPICIEPVLNGLGQKGIGAYLKDRLARWGVNLKDQSINQRLAALAGDQGLSTVDFSSASDTISYSLVWSLLPVGWAELLDQFRCPRYQAEGSWYNFQKFSSMGNAYTFELETLIFFALALACMDELSIPAKVQTNVHVYGDDVIIPREAFDLFKQVCGACGFTINASKSYRDGNFFESCGADYHMGHLVTPLRQKNALDVPEAVYLAANNCVRMAERLTTLAGSNPLGSHRSALVRPSADCGSYSGRSTNQLVARLAGVHLWIVQHLRAAWRVYGPASAAPSDPSSGSELGDSHIWCPWDFLCPRIGTFGYRYRTVALVPNKRMPWSWLSSWAAYAAAEYPNAGYPLYLAQQIKSPLNGWLSDDTTWEGNIMGYVTRGDVRRKRTTAWARDWSFPWSCHGIFYVTEVRV